MAITVVGIRKEVETSDGFTANHWGPLPYTVNPTLGIINLLIVPWKDIQARAAGKKPLMSLGIPVTVTFQQLGVSATSTIAQLQAALVTHLLSLEELSGGESESLTI